MLLLLLLLLLLSSLLLPTGLDCLGTLCSIKQHASCISNMDRPCVNSCTAVKIHLQWTSAC